VNLEPLDVREFARIDPRGFLAEHATGVILDEIQNVPELVSYIQADVDEDPSPGRFILTGSRQLAANRAIGQTLAVAPPFCTSSRSRSTSAVRPRSGRKTSGSMSFAEATPAFTTVVSTRFDGMPTTLRRTWNAT
jgi:hypothetical protein